MCIYIYRERERYRCIKYILVSYLYIVDTAIDLSLSFSEIHLAESLQQPSELPHWGILLQQQRPWRIEDIEVSLRHTTHATVKTSEASGLALGLTLYLIALRLGVQTLEMVRGYGNGDCDGYD